MDLESRTIEVAPIDTTRALAKDAVEKAASGHPGTPMSLAPFAYTTCTNLVRHNPESVRARPERGRRRL
ncbi:MAG: hypothetical protein ACRDTR_00975 [Rubrobacter sp.]